MHGADEAVGPASVQVSDSVCFDQVSLNEITAASGQLNRSAVRYHFGTRDGLVRALVARSMTPIDAERTALLDHLEATRKQLDPREAVEVVIGPLARQLRTLKGRRYLRLCGQTLNHPKYTADAREALSANQSIARTIRHLAPLLIRLPPAIAAERASQVVGFIVRTLADQARLIDADPPPRTPLPENLFTANLIDTSLAMLTAPTTASGPAPDTTLSRPKPM